MAIHIQFWRSDSGTADSDFNLIDTIPDASPFSWTDPSTLTPGVVYAYKMRRYDDVFLTYSPFSDIVFVRGAWPIVAYPPQREYNNMSTSTLETYVGIASKLGIGLEATEGQPVLAQKLLDRVSGSLELDRTIIARKSLRNNAAITGVVPGIANVAGDIVLEPTPEGISALLCAFLGMPTSVVNAPTPAVTVAFSGGTPTGAAKAYAVVSGGAVTSIVMVDQGAGYTSDPTCTVSGGSGTTTITSITRTGGKITAVTIGASSGYAAQTVRGSATHTWTDGFDQFTATISELRGNSVYCFPGARVSSMSIRVDKEQTEPLNLSASLVALNQIMYAAMSDLGLDVAGYDVLPAMPAVETFFKISGSVSADCKSVDIRMNKNLQKRHVLDGYMGANSHYMQRSEHSATATLFFSTEDELKQFFGQAEGVSTPYGALKDILYVPLEIDIISPPNGYGYNNEMSIVFPNATYQKLGAPVRGPEAIMQEITILPILDPTTNTSLQVAITNGETLSSFTSFGTAVSAVPANDVTAFTAP